MSLQTPPTPDRAASKLPSSQVDREYRYWRVRLMYSMVTGYALFYFVRNNLSIAAKPIIDEFKFTNTQWGFVLSTATIVYAFSKFASGIIGDRANPRYLMAVGLIASGAVNLVFGLGHSLVFFCGFWALNNLFQGTGVPPCIRILTSWFSQREIGRAWGVWNASHQVGGAVIAVWAAWLVTHFGWRSAFWAPAGLAILGGCWLLNRLRDSPEATGLPTVEEYHGMPSPARSADRPPYWPMFRSNILTNARVWLVSFANFFVYVVRIGVLSWAPKYLVEAKGFSLASAGLALFAFEISGMFGAYAAGWISDRLGRRGPVSVIALLLLVLSIAALFLVPRGNVVAMMAVFASAGFLVYGPQMLVAVAAADFATKAAASSAVGLTGLLGYFGATACGIGTGWLVDHHGWSSAIWCYAAAAAIGCVLLIPTWSIRAQTARA